MQNKISRILFGESDAIRWLTIGHQTLNAGLGTWMLFAADIHWHSLRNAIDRWGQNLRFGAPEPPFSMCQFCIQSNNHSNYESFTRKTQEKKLIYLFNIYCFASKRTRLFSVLRCSLRLIITGNVKMMGMKKKNNKTIILMKNQIHLPVVRKPCSSAT